LTQGQHPPLDEIYALGELATRRGRLREETYVALLELAAGDASRPPLPVAFYPLSRVPHLPPSVIERTREVATACLAASGSGRVFAVVALGRTDRGAVDLLVKVVGQAGAYTPAERIAAVDALVRFGSAGQRALRKLLPSLLPDTSPLQATGLVSADFLVVLAVLEAIDSLGNSGPVLRKLAELSAPQGAPASVLRRVSLLRCTAANLLVERAYDDPLLVNCDLTAADDSTRSVIGPRAALTAIGIVGARIRGQRHRAWRRYATDSDAVIRQAALGLISQHPEIHDAAEILAKALRSDQPGVIAAAAEIILSDPQRVRRRVRRKKAKAPSPVDPGIAAALQTRLVSAGPTADPRVLSRVIAAVGALGLKSAEGKLRKLCLSPDPQIRYQVQRAFGALGAGAVRCDPPKAGVPLPAELNNLVQQPVTLRLKTDVGRLELRLDPSLAPIAVTRIVELARNGSYRSMPVDRIRPGFVAYFGTQPVAEGGTKRFTPVPDESAPVPFLPGSVGVAYSHRAATTELFITHRRVPHLDGRYGWVGSSSGPWAALVQGDIIRSVAVITKQ